MNDDQRELMRAVFWGLLEGLIAMAIFVAFVAVSRCGLEPIEAPSSNEAPR